MSHQSLSSPSSPRAENAQPPITEVSTLTAAGTVSVESSPSASSTSPAASTPNPETTKTAPTIGFWESFFLGGTITCASRSLVAPIERIKLLMQCEGELLRHGKLILTSSNTSIATETKAAADFACSAASINAGGKNAAAAAASARLAARRLESGNSTLYYTSMLDCAKKTMVIDGAAAANGGVGHYSAARGFASLWRGNLSTILRYFPAQGMNFATNGTFKKLQGLDRESNGFWLWFFGNVLGGGCAGTLTLAVVYSLEYTRTRMALDIQSTTARRNHTAPLAVPEHQFRNTRDCVRQTIKVDGLVGLYRGFWITVIATFIKQGLYFGIFDTLNPLFSYGARATAGKGSQKMDIFADNSSCQTADDSENKMTNGQKLLESFGATFFGVFMLGWFSTFTANMLSHPFDTVRRRMICTTAGPERFRYNGSFDCFLKITKAEGYRTLWRGITPAAFSSISGGLALALFDRAIRPNYFALRGVEQSTAKK